MIVSEMIIKLKTFPQDKEQILHLIKNYLDGSAEDKMLFQIGRRFGFLLQPDDLKKVHLKERCMEISRQFNITPDNIDSIIEKNMQRGI